MVPALSPTSALKIEHELKFVGIEIEKVVELIGAQGGALLRLRHLLRRRTFDIPGEPRGTFVRVRDEGDRITLTLKKQYQPDGEVYELEECVESFEVTAQLLESMGMLPATYEENYREVYQLAHALITVDTWPGLESFIEVEAESADDLALACQQLQLPQAQGLKGPVDVVYKSKGIDITGIKTLTFDVLPPHCSATGASSSSLSTAVAVSHTCASGSASS
jgi:adenylate cyclase class 2